MLLRWTARLIAGVFILLLLLGIIMQFSFVQTYLVNRVATLIMEST